MNKSIVTYETQHGSAKKASEIIAKKLNTKCINIDTPFEAEDLKEIDNLILVFNFRGPYTAQLTKLYLERVKSQLKNKNVFLVGEGLFSEKEFPVVADEINKNFPSKTFNIYFINGQLRVDTLYPEEKALLKKFSEITKMEIKDMGNFDEDKANKVAEEILEFTKNNRIEENKKEKEQKTEKTKWVCPMCGYVHYGENPPEKCPLCGVSGDTFTKQQ